MAGMLRVPRTRGALSGVLLVLLGLWGGLAALAGPYFDFAFAPDKAWHFTSGRLLLQVVPAAAALLGGLLVLLSANRIVAIFGAGLAAAGGTWLIVGVPFSRIWGSSGDVVVGAPLGGATRQALEWVALLYGLGAAILFLAATALGRFMVVGVKEARAAGRARAAEVPRRPEAERPRWEPVQPEREETGESSPAPRAGGQRGAGEEPPISEEGRHRRRDT